MATGAGTTSTGKRIVLFDVDGTLTPARKVGGWLLVERSTTDRVAGDMCAARTRTVRIWPGHGQLDMNSGNLKT